MSSAPVATGTLRETPPVMAAGADEGSSSRSEPPTLIITSAWHWRRWVADLVQYRGALYSLGWRNVRSRYKQAALGMSWAVLQPLAQVLVFTVFFGILAGIPSDDVPYPLFALAGLVAWNLFQKIVTEGATSLVVNQNIITKLFFPRIFLVVAAGASAFIDALVAIVLLVIMMLVFDVAPGPSAWLAIPALVAVVLFSYGFAALLAALNARWRDIQHTIPFALQLGLFVTPVIYRSTLVPERYQWLLALNPLSGMIELFRSATLGLSPPDARLVAISLASSVLIAAVGLWWFVRSEAAVVDVV